MRRIATFVLLACGVVSCSAELEPVPVCPETNAYPSFLITVRDSATGTVITAGSTIIVTARVGSVGDTVEVPNVAARNAYPTGIELGPGTFDVEVRRPGYQQARRQDITVRGNSCGGAVTVTLDIALAKT